MPASIFEAREWILLRRVGGERLSLTHSVAVAKAVRGALMRHAQMISGHTPDGGPTPEPHLAIVPLPNVGHRHADGALLGVALILPKEVAADGRQALYRALGKWEGAARVEIGDDEIETPPLSIGFGEGLSQEFERLEWQAPTLVNLKPRIWTGPSAQWMTATPIALDRNPGNLFAEDSRKADAAFRAAAETVAGACVNIGLPQPADVTILPSGTWPGGLKARLFPPFPPEKAKFRRLLVHARIRFAEEVEGPLLLGAGRFFGLGLCRPMEEVEQP